METNEYEKIMRFIVDGSLYAYMPITDLNVESFCRIIKGNGRYMNYCKECGEKRPFQYIVKNSDGCRMDFGNEYSRVARSLGANVNKSQYLLQKITELTMLVFEFTCTLDNSHNQIYLFTVEKDVIRKIGQYPSLADLSFPELKNHEKILGTDYMKELKRAIGLNAQGIGIGSYVYLRRIFEDILDKAKERAEVDRIPGIEEYSKKRVHERIQLLKDYLPTAIVESAAFYSIVSKGIHELSEEDCLKYFPILQECILMILEEWEEKRQKDIRKNKLSVALNNIAGNI